MVVVVVAVGGGGECMPLLKCSLLNLKANVAVTVGSD